MPGKITKIMVSVGDTVNEDDEVLLLEAMKMENPIFAPTGGTIKEIKCKTGDSVNGDQVLLVME
jgi:acetyl-CoA carboxylase biotin carboxyl carrier protein